MHTLGYSFKPWEQAKAIADGPAILSYVRETARENGVEGNIRFDHKVIRAEWSSAEARWTVEVQDGKGDDRARLTCDFLFVCSGYYRYDEGYSPVFPGSEAFSGPVVHPQHWPENLDYAGKRVVVIGSGATAVTLVPAMAETAEHVTMLQRSPSYVAAVPAEDPIANFARQWLPPKAAYALTRWKNVLLTMLVFNLSRRRPEWVRRFIRKEVERHAPAGFDVDTHFKPSYNPWDQRMCLVPDGDLFRALHEGRTSMVTDQIETFTQTGIKLASGAELDADVIVTATGLNLQLFGGMEVFVDGHKVEASERITYKSLMLSDVPNLAFTIGYTNASWTLKCDLTCEYVCRLLNHMDERGYAYCVPTIRDPEMETIPLLDFTSGYVTRSIHELPSQGSKPPWRLHMSYGRDILTLRHGELEDGTMEFVPASSLSPAAEPQAAIA